MVRAIGMLAGGTGITPMLQIIRAIMKNPKDKTEVSLIFGNIAEEDILLHKELDDLAAKYPSTLKLYHVLNNPPPKWQGGVGFITKEMIEQHLPHPASDIKIVMCGPPLMNKAMEGHLQAIGYPAEQFFIF